MSLNLRHWMTLCEGLPNDFIFSNWGYWIESDGHFVPVKRHQHHTVHSINDHTFAEGRIRCTAVTDPTTVKMEDPIKLFTANFYTRYVTKPALRSLMALIAEYEFDEFHITGMTIQQDQLGDYNRDPIQHVDPRSIEYADTRAKALQCVRSFMTTARIDSLPQQDKHWTEPNRLNI